MSRPYRMAHPRFVPDGTPRLTRRERAEWALFLVGLVAIPFVLAVVPRP